MQHRSDESLMQAYANGDIEAFETLYRRHSAPLYRYLRRQVTDEATANDLFQGSWEKIVKSRQRYSPSAPFAAWMYRIARNHLIDHFRTLKPTEELPEAARDESVSEPLQSMNSLEQASRLRAAIVALPAEQRDALLLKLEGGLSLNEIAIATGVNPETAKSRLRYAVARLKSHFSSTTEEGNEGAVEPGMTS